MSCDHCIVGAYHCDLQRDRVWGIDRDARLTFFAPDTKGVDDIVGKQVVELIHPLDADYVEQKLHRALVQRESVSWLTRDVWNRRTWLTHVEPETDSLTGPHAVATSRPVCPLIFELSTRQREILQQLTACCCTKKLASEVGVKLGTVQAHLYRIQIATRRHDRTELSRWANDMQHALLIESEIQAYLTRRQK